MDPILVIQLLGEFNLHYGAVPLVTINTPRLQSLLAYLLLHRQAPQARAHLAFLLWPDLPEARARANLRRQLHQLQHAWPEVDRFLSVTAQTLQWQPSGAYSLDVAEFEQAAGQTQSVADLRRAVQVYRGDLLPSCYADWIVPERERLRQLLIEVLECLLQRAAAEADYHAAIKYAQQLLQLDPLHEEIHRHLIHLHTLHHDRAAALRAYHACASILQRELGVGPSSATRELYEQLLSLEATTRPPLEENFPLVGREREWAQLQTAWRTASAGQAQLVILSGEAGIGKTRLADELFRRLTRQGLNTASAHCYAAEGALAYAPVVAWLRARPMPNLDPIWLSEVARLLPEILMHHPEVPAPGPLTEAWQRQRLHEALARVVLGNGEPLLLWIEDLHWCDRDTLEWLHYVVRFDAQARLLIVGTLRPEEVFNDHPVTVLLAALRRNRKLIEIAVGPLDAADTHHLAAYVAGRQLDGMQADCLYRETEGNPLFIVEAVRANSACIEANALTPTVQAVIATRLAQLSSPARELMELAATVGREFTFEILKQADELDEKTLVRSLDELWQRRIIREIGTNAYDFSHGKLREVAYAGLSAARRRLLHRQVAEALVALQANATSFNASIAAHYQHAGLTEQAISYYQRAAAAAQHVYAHADALAYLSRALELNPVSAVTHCQLLLAREKIYAWQGARQAQARDLTTLRDRADALADPIWQAQVAVEQGNYWRDISDLGAAITAAQQALTWIAPAKCQTPDRVDRVLIGLEIEARYLWGTTLDFQGRYEEACVQHRQALALAREHGLRQAEARCLYGLSRTTAEASACQEYLEASLSIQRALGDQPGQSLCLDQLGYHLAVMGEYEAAAAYYEQALSLARQIGFRPCEANVLFRLGVLHNQLGDYAGSKAYLEQAVTLARQDNDQRSAAQSLYNLSWAERGLGRFAVARNYAQKALTICQAIGDRNGEAAAWRNLAEAWRALGAYAEAAAAFRAMLTVCRALADHDGLIDATTGLAVAMLAQGDTVQAKSDIDAVLLDRELPGLWQGTYVDLFPDYLACYQVLRANCDPRAGVILEVAYTLLQERAACLTSAALRHAFLENVVEHRQIIQAWHARTEKLSPAGDKMHS